MIWKAGGIIKLEDGEPALRSCWKCNGAHEHLKDTDYLHCCFGCGKYWILGKFIPTLNTDKATDKYFGEKLGLKSGISTLTKELNDLSKEE